MPVICPQHSELGDLETVRRRSVKPLRFRRPAGHGGTVLASLGATSNPWIISPQAPIILAKWLSDPIVSQVWAYYSGGISAASAVAQVQQWATPGFVPPSSNFSYSVGSPNGATIPGYKDAQGRTIKAYAAVQMWPAAGGMYGAVPALHAYVTSLVGGNLLTQVANPNTGGYSAQQIQQGYGPPPVSVYDPVVVYALERSDGYTAQVFAMPGIWLKDILSQYGNSIVWHNVAKEDAAITKQFLIATAAVAAAVGGAIALAPAAAPAAAVPAATGLETGIAEGGGGAISTGVSTLPASAGGAFGVTGAAGSGLTTAAVTGGGARTTAAVTGGSGTAANIAAAAAPGLLQAGTQLAPSLITAITGQGPSSPPAATAPASTLPATIFGLPSGLALGIGAGLLLLIAATK